MKLPDVVTGSVIATVGGAIMKAIDFLWQRLKASEDTRQTGLVAEVNADVSREGLLWQRINSLEQRLDERERNYQNRIEKLEARISELEIDNECLRTQLLRLDPKGNV